MQVKCKFWGYEFFDINPIIDFLNVKNEGANMLQDLIHHYKSAVDSIQKYNIFLIAKRDLAQSDFKVFCEMLMLS